MPVPVPSASRATRHVVASLPPVAAIVLAALFGVAGLVGPAAAQPTHGKLTVTVSAGQATVKGRVSRPGRSRVTLQRHTARGWHPEAHSRTTARGRFSFTVATSGLYRVRARLAHGGGTWTSRRVRVQLPTTPHPGGGSHTPPPPRRTPWVTGYYAGWFWDDSYPPQQVDMTAMTHFVFGRVAPGGGSLGGEPASVVPGAGTGQEPGSSPAGDGGSVEDYLVRRAHAAGTKALLMVGGDGADGKGFMLSTARPTLLKSFAGNVVDYLVAHDYDGLDLDWENCLDGGADCGEATDQAPVSAEEARRRLITLIGALRDEAADRARYADRPLVITFPGYPVNTNFLQPGGKVEPWQAQVATLVDQYNLMSYGIGTTWNGAGWRSWFSGALDGATGTTPVSIASSIAAYVASGVPAAKLGMGIGFYGIYYGPDITGPRQDTESNDIYETDDAALGYAALKQMGYLDHGELKWDQAASSTYRTYPGGYVPSTDTGRNPAGFLSYEDERSIAAKAAWAKAHGLGGTILWTINYGYLADTATNPLLEAVKHDFLGR